MSATRTLDVSTVYEHNSALNYVELFLPIFRCHHKLRMCYDYIEAIFVRLWHW